MLIFGQVLADQQADFQRRDQGEYYDDRRYCPHLNALESRRFWATRRNAAAVADTRHPEIIACRAHHARRILHTVLGNNLYLVIQQRLQVVHKLRSEEHTSELQSLMRISYAV